MEPFIKINKLKKVFGKNDILKDLNFKIFSNEIISLIGSSGAGKTTFLRCINLLERPSGGEIFYRGKNILKLTGNSIADYRTKIGMVFQQFNLFANMSIIKNCTVGQVKVLKIPKTEAIANALNYLKKVGMEQYINAKPHQLSGGQKQRVAIARALCMQPEILLLDEPTSALDPESVGEILNILKLLVNSGITMLISTHEMEFAREVSTRVAFMDNGEILETNLPKEIFDSPHHKRTKNFLSRFLKSKILG